MPTITSPTDQDTFVVYQTVTFTGTATDQQDGTSCCQSKFSWFVELGGQNLFVGTGTSQQYDNFQPGSFVNGPTIILQVEDLDGNVGTTRAFPNVRVGSDPLAFDIDEQEIRVGDGMDDVVVIADGANPAWSPDGSRLAFERFDGTDWEIWVADADGSNPMQITGNAVDDDSPAWSPDGTRLAYVSESSGNRDIYIIDLQTSAITPVTATPGTENEPDWRGTVIAFESDRDGDLEIWRVNDDLSTAPVQLTFNTVDDRDPHWYPDGSKIVFSTERDGNFEVYVMDADGANQTNLTSHPAEDREAEPSPDQTKIIFLSDRESAGVDKMFVSRIDGSSPLVVEDLGTSREPGHPRWSP